MKKQRKLSPDHWYLNEPEVLEGCGFLLQAYSDLVTCRPAEGPIPWDKVALYAQAKGLDPDNADLLWSVVRAMDHADRQWRTENPLGSGEVIQADA